MDAFYDCFIQLMCWQLAYKATAAASVTGAARVVTKHMDLHTCMIH